MLRARSRLSCLGLQCPAVETCRYSTVQNTPVSGKAKKTYTPRGYWDSVENRRAFLEELRDEMLASGAADGATWMAKLRVRAVRDKGGSSLMQKYSNSLSQLLHATYDASEVELGRLPKNYFADHHRRRAFLDSIAKEFNIQCPADWKRVTVSTVKERGGASLLKRYRTFADALRDVYPEQDFEEDCSFRQTAPNGYWKDPANRKRWLEGFSKEMGIEKTEDWMKVTSRDVLERGGGALLNFFKGSLFLALQEAFGEHISRDSCRKTKQLGYWTSRDNRRAFLDELGEKFHVEKPSDWSKVSTKDLVAEGGGGLLQHYSSFWAALKDVYKDDFPNFSWRAEECRSVMPRDYWKSDEHVKSFIEKVGQELCVTRKEDWYRVSYEQLVELGGSALLKRLKLADMLQLAYPGELWDISQFGIATKKSTQRMLRIAVEDVFKSRVEEDYRYSLEELGDESLPPAIELDVFVAEHNIGFEYNGEHHYFEVAHYGALDVHRRRDLRKVEACQRAGVRLVTVPYWWDRQVASLLATILDQHPSVGADIRASLSH